MLFLLFQLGEDRYALDAGQVVEVLPLVGITRDSAGAAGRGRRVQLPRRAGAGDRSEPADAGPAGARAA